MFVFSYKNPLHTCHTIMFDRKITQYNTTLVPSLLLTFLTTPSLPTMMKVDIRTSRDTPTWSAGDHAGQYTTMAPPKYRNTETILEVQKLTYSSTNYSTITTINHLISSNNRCCGSQGCHGIIIHHSLSSEIRTSVEILSPVHFFVTISP